MPKKLQQTASSQRVVYLLKMNVNVNILPGRQYDFQTKSYVGLIDAAKSSMIIITMM